MHFTSKQSRFDSLLVRSACISIELSVMSKLYFAYDTNLWPEQMIERCPTAVWKGFFVLEGYAWIINARGVATIVHVPSEPRENGLKNQTRTFGGLWELQASDEIRLDYAEGPECHKRWIDVEGVPEMAKHDRTKDQLSGVHTAYTYFDLNNPFPDKTATVTHDYRMRLQKAAAVLQDAHLDSYTPYVREVFRAYFEFLSDGQILYYHKRWKDGAAARQAALAKPRKRRITRDEETALYDDLNYPSAPTVHSQHKPLADDRSPAPDPPAKLTQTIPAESSKREHSTQPHRSSSLTSTTLLSKPSQPHSLPATSRSQGPLTDHIARPHPVLARIPPRRDSVRSLGSAPTSYGHVTTTSARQGRQDDPIDRRPRQLPSIRTQRRVPQTARSSRFNKQASAYRSRGQVPPSPISPITPLAQPRSSRRRLWKSGQDMNRPVLEDDRRTGVVLEHRHRS